MVEPDIEESLLRLCQSLERIKALVAWEQLKHGETRPSRISVFRMRDSTEGELQNEYSFFIATLSAIRSVLNDRSFCISEAVREDIGRQLADIEQEVYALDTFLRLGGPRR